MVEADGKKRRSMLRIFVSGIHEEQIDA